MSILKTIYLQHLNGSGPNATLDANGNMTVTGTVAGAFNSTGRNKIINGDMRVDQRNSGSSVTQSTSTGYTVDRWACYGTQASKFTVQQNAGSITPPVGYSNYLGCTSSSAYSITSTDRFQIAQPIEGYNMADLAWGTSSAKTVTLSFWVYSSLTGTFGGAVFNYDGSRSYPFSYTISSTNTWTYITVTIPGDTAGTWFRSASPTAIGLNVLLSLGSGSTLSGPAGSWAGAFYTSATGATSVVGASGATFYVTGIQLETGTKATPFETRSIQHELSLCQRYYQRFTNAGGTAFVSGANWSAGQGYGVYYYKQTMRAAPTGNVSAVGALQWYTNGNSYVSTAISIQSMNADAAELAISISGTITAGYAGWARFNGGWIDFTAEL